MSTLQLHLAVAVPVTAVKRSKAAKFAAEVESSRSIDLLDAKAVAGKAAALFELAFNERPRNRRRSFEREYGKRICRSLGRRLAVAALVPDSRWHQGLLKSWEAPDLVEVRQVAAVLVELYQPLFGGCDLAALIGLKEEWL